MLDPCRPLDHILPLTVSGLTYRAGGRTLIDKIDCLLRDGTRTVILGPNGAGKSLFIRLLHGLLEPAEGEISWNGKTADQDVRRRQAMVFQSPVLLRRSAADNIRFALQAHRRTPADIGQKTSDALARAGLSHRAQVPARRLSGGERQKLAIARALVTDPDILFLDEPTASLDPASTAEVEDMINAAHLRGIKILLITHNIAQARRLADDIMFLHGGKITESGPAKRFFRNPQSAPARDYLAGRIPV
ncbi:MAG: ATP-binding cassette domain-containing protein [Fimbriimonadaceae bacterium]|nr:ATP-binding cassette domain-containing protein [Alphaproteobacteria bacterium]